MSAGFCLHCGLRLNQNHSVAEDIDAVHEACADAWHAEQARIAKTPKSSIEQQLDRIEGLLMAIRDRYSL